MLHDRRKDIQGLRAISVTAVVCYHAGLALPGGFTGVDAFFVISGFVITLTLLREWRDTGKIDLANFYVRRFKRLAPALSVVVATTVLFGFLFLSPLSSQVLVTTMTGMGALLMTANAVIATQTGGYFQLAASKNPLLNMWSLSVEEQFYILFPFALLCGLAAQRRFKAGRYLALAMVFAIALLSLLAVARSLHPGLSPAKQLLLGFYSPITRAWEFAAGAMLALVCPAGPRNALVATTAIVLGSALLAVSFFFINSQSVFPGPLTLIPIIATTALIWGGGRSSGPISRIIGSKPFVTIGNLSYSWYLWHWPAIVFAASFFGDKILVKSIAGFLSLIPAAAAYRWIEDPLRRYKLPTVSKRFRFVVTTLTPALTACLALYFANIHGYWSRSLADYQNTLDQLHAGKVAGCGDGYVPTPNKTNQCDFNASAKGKPIYLVGDSNADQFSEAVITAATVEKRPVKIITKGGCAFIGRSWSDTSPSEQSSCLTFVDALRSLLREAPPGQVIIGISDSLWNYAIPVGPSQEKRYTSRDGIQKYLQQELTGLVHELRARGHQVVLLQAIPKFITKEKLLMFEPTECTTIEALFGRCPHQVVVTMEFERDLQQYARKAMAGAAKSTGSLLLDFYPYLCPQMQCSNVSATGKILYRDPGHLSVEGSKILSAVFLPMLKAQQ